MPETALERALATTAPRETSGSRTAARYDFQTNYGILELISLTEAGADYRVLFDYFDDIVVLKPSVNPTEISLLQLKSKDGGSWTCAMTCAANGAMKPRAVASRL